MFKQVANVARSIIQTGLVLNMSTEMFKTPMELAVYQLHNFSISFFSSFLGGDVVSVKLDNRYADFTRLLDAFDSRQDYSRT